MTKKVKWLSLGPISIAPIFVAMSCNTQAEPKDNNVQDSDFRSNDLTKLTSKISQAKINSLPENDKNTVNSLVELFKANNELIDKYDQITTKGPDALNGKFGQIFKLIDGKDNNLSIVAIANKIALKIKATAKEGKEELSKINKLFEHVVFNKLEDLTADLREVFKDYSKTKMQENSVKLVQYILQKSNNKSDIKYLDEEALPSNQYLDNVLNSLNQEVTNIYFDDKYFNQTQKNRTIDSILEKDFSSSESTDEHNHEHASKNKIESNMLLVQINEYKKSDSFSDKLKNLTKKLETQIHEDINLPVDPETIDSEEEIMKKHSHNHKHDHDHGHSHETDEESHSHSHALANLMYDFYQSVQILVKKVKVSELVEQLNKYNQTLDNDHKIDQEITALSNSLENLKKEFSTSVVESANEFFKSTVLQTDKIHNLIIKSSKLANVTIRNTKTKLANEE
ncbi:MULTISPECIES: hypothetical protein [unclassified Mycoplasma]|uniref:hypothetical protein n=1 Tax=unclassified Mycoplasma TaxID=2683645 RepID=UPI00211C957F|nr:MULTISPECIES: hypothetical protein [unclassified Mycoplasma]UUM19992.1 hypothetical protein NPA11_00955 [Mycoplasma sp. 1578d]UUM24973.1 hypothetical protein NPA12_00940 [Mycoplasma sp. 3686d]